MKSVGGMSTVSGVSVLAVSSDGGYVNVKETQALDLPMQNPYTNAYCIGN